jgi:hypothetical protein
VLKLAAAVEATNRRRLIPVLIACRFLGEKS